MTGELKTLSITELDPFADVPPFALVDLDLESETFGQELLVGRLLIDGRAFWSPMYRAVHEALGRALQRGACRDGVDILQELERSDALRPHWSSALAFLAWWSLEDPLARARPDAVHELDDMARHRAIRRHAMQAAVAIEKRDVEATLRELHTTVRLAQRLLERQTRRAA